MNDLDRAAMDRLLSALDIRTSVFTICDVRAGWKVEFDPLATTHCHLVIGGGGQFQSHGATFAADPQTLLLVPAGHSYSVESGAPVRRVLKGELSSKSQQGSIPILRAGNGPAGVLTACGTAQAFYAGILDLLAGLPRAIAHRLPDADLLAAQIARLRPEIEQPQPGTRAMIEAVLKQCLILLLRESEPARTIPLPWSPGSSYPSLWRAFMAMGERIDARHRLDELAAVAGMSRSAFAEHFPKAFGKSPMALLREMRLRRAAQLLQQTSLPIEAVALKVGYGSRSQFSHAFRRVFGVDPRRFRSEQD